MLPVLDFNDFNQNQYCNTENENNDVFSGPNEINWYKTKRMHLIYFLYPFTLKKFLVTLRKNEKLTSLTIQ